jgi:hypothetical protein
MNLYGLMITKDDGEVFGDWCRDQLSLYDAVICLDGSADEATARVAREFSQRLVYFHESHFYLPYKTDHGLRRVVHQEIVRRFGCDNWIMCCHADEFCYHDPRKAAAKAEQEGADWVGWFSLHFYPHPDDLAQLPALRRLPVPDRVRHYHWSYRGSGIPWIESRLYHNNRQVTWDRSTHSSTLPHGLARQAGFHPIVRHFKAYSLEPEDYDSDGKSAFYRTRWMGLPVRTGVPFPVKSRDDLFVSSIPDYDRCDYFDGTIRHPWNMGEDFRTEVRLPMQAGQ